jgi:Tfp pilus assembly protein PilF
VLGPNHPDTAESLNNLGGLLRVQSEYATARPLYERALAIREQVLGPDHPDTASSLNNLAVCIEMGYGEYAEARRLFERAIAIDEKTLGTDHPQTRRHRDNLAGLLQKMHASGEGE